MEKLQIGSKVKIATMYGGGSGYVEEIVGSFVIVKTNSNEKISIHESDLTDTGKKL